MAKFEIATTAVDTTLATEEVELSDGPAGSAYTSNEGGIDDACRGDDEGGDVEERRGDAGGSFEVGDASDGHAMLETFPVVVSATRPAVECTATFGLTGWMLDGLGASMVATDRFVWVQSGHRAAI